MSELSSLGLSKVRLWRGTEDATEQLYLHRPLDRIFAFTGYGIDDVVANPIAKNAVLGYYKLQKQIMRSSEVVDLERHWNR